VLPVILRVWPQPAQRASPPSIALVAIDPSRGRSSDFFTD
jgi:hypothetical protein